MSVKDSDAGVLVKALSARPPSQGSAAPAVCEPGRSPYAAGDLHLNSDADESGSCQLSSAASFCYRPARRPASASSIVYAPHWPMLELRQHTAVYSRDTAYLRAHHCRSASFRVDCATCVSAIVRGAAAGPAYHARTRRAAGGV